MKTKSIFIIRLIACGSVTGGCLIDSKGAPLTRRSANAIADKENALTAYRREKKMPGPHYDYYVDCFSPTLKGTP